MEGPELLALARDGSKIALISAGGKLTYDELGLRASQIAGTLFALGLRPGDRFAFLLPNAPDILCTYIAAARSGLVGVPVSQRITAGELRFQMNDSGAVALVYDIEYGDLVEAERQHMQNLRHLVNVADIGSENGVDPAPHADLQGDAPFCVMYTGGTTGASKAAIQTRQAWDCCLRTSVEEWGLEADDHHLIVLPMSHAAWYTAGATLLAGGTVSIQRNWNPDQMLDLIEERKITTLNMIPTMLADLVRAYETRPRKVDSVRLLTVAGSVLPIATYRRACAIFGEVIGNIYGLTEAAGPVTFLNPPEMKAGKYDSVGRPSRCMELAIIDADGRPASQGDVGEIGLAGPQITPGYLGRARETVEAFSGKWFLTGDIGRLDEDGFLYIVDRSKDMIKSGGFNIYPSEVEQVIYRQPEVLECAVLGLADEKWAEAVHAIVVLKAGQTCTEAELIARCRRELAGYKVPKRVHFETELPRTRFGKFDKARLRRDLTAAIGGGS